MKNYDWGALQAVKDFFSKYPKKVIKDKYIVIEYPNTVMEQVINYSDSKFEAYKFKKENNPKAKVIWGNVITAVYDVGIEILYGYEEKN